jgi:serine phosphatase RsbU (regulator of sigma subunit)
MKASQAISGEIVLSKLLEKLMKIIIENAGAQVGYLIWESQGKMAIEASSHVDSRQVTVLQSLPMDDRVPESLLNYVTRTRETVVKHDAVREGRFTKDPYIQGHQTKSILCAPLINQGKLIGIVYLENNLTAGAFTPERVEVLQILSGQAAIAIENAQFYHTLEEKVADRTAKLAAANQEITKLNERLKAENLRMSAELEVTQKLQQMVLPNESELEAIEGLEIAGFMEPADEVGGDYYDVLQQDGKVKLAIGDVTGHGLESGILMIMTQTAVRSLLSAQETDPVKFLDAINRTIYGNVERMNSDKNLTLCLLDYAEGVVSLSGQHEDAIVVRADGTIELIDTMDLGFPIGLDAEIADFIAQTSVQLCPGDGIVLYTDGITEAEDIEGVQYGQERLCEVISQNWQGSAKEVRQAVVDDVRRHMGAQKVYDDITLLVLKQK